MIYPKADKTYSLLIHTYVAKLFTEKEFMKLAAFMGYRKVDKHIKF